MALLYCYRCGAEVRKSRLSKQPTPIIRENGSDSIGTVIRFRLLVRDEEVYASGHPHKNKIPTGLVIWHEGAMCRRTVLVQHYFENDNVFK